MLLGSLNLWRNNQLGGGGNANILRSDFWRDNELPEGFTFTGSESYSDGGLELDGSEWLEKILDGEEPWFNGGESGFMVIRYKTPSFPTTDQYLMDFHADSGSVYPSIALRSYRDDGRPRAAVYRASGEDAFSSTSGNFSIPTDTYHFAALTWDGTRADIYDDNDTNGGTVNTVNTYNALTIGDDHNGGQTLEGVIAMMETGVGVPSLAQIFSKAFIPGDYIIEALGQSQANHLFNDNDGSTRNGHQAIIENFQKFLNEPNIVFVINASDSGSAILTSSSPSDAWVDNSSTPFTDSIRLTQSMDAASIRGQKPRGGFWWQYQGDVFSIANGNSTIEDYADGLDHILAKKKSVYGDDYKMALVPIGGRNEAVTDDVDAAHQTIRETVLAKIAEGNGYVRGPEVYDLGTFDTTGHLSAAENAIAGKRLGINMAHRLGLGVSNYLLPNSVTRSDFTGGTGWTQNGFRFTGAAATGFITANNATIETTETYEVEFTIEDDYSAGSVRILLYDSNTVAVGTTRSAAGTYTEELTVSSATGTAGTYATIQVQTAFTGTIDVSKVKIRKKAESSTVGPAATGFSNTAGMTTIDITHDKGTDFNTQPVGGYEGFAVFDEDGSQLAITNVTRVDADSLMITHAVPAGSTISVKYPYGALEGVTLSNTVKDNSPELMPLQTFVETGITVG